MKFNEVQATNFFKSYKTLIDEYAILFETKLSELSREKEAIYEQHIHTFERSFNQFSTQGNTLLKSYKEENLTKAWEFSIFNIVNIKRIEESLHSPFLKELIDPNGRHGQGDVFYRLFLETLDSKIPLKNFTNNNTSEYYVKAEEYFKNGDEKGELDIFIKSENPKKPFTVFIEVKWESGDSCENQLFKYINFLKAEYSQEQILVVYLTKHGENPTWVTDDNFKMFLKNERGISYFPISYKEHIINWLLACEKECKAPKVNHIIEQYITLIIENDYSIRKKNLRPRNKKRKL